MKKSQLFLRTTATGLLILLALCGQAPATEPDSLASKIDTLMTGWDTDDPAFDWTLDLFRHFGSGKRLFKAVASSQSGALARRETTQRLERLVQAELSRLQVARKLDAFRVETVVRFLVGTFIGFMDWWMREENEHLPAEQVDHAFRSLVLPGVANVLELDLELPKAL